MKTFVLATLLATATALPVQAASFTFSETFARAEGPGGSAVDFPVTATGSFDGDLSGMLITNLRNISVFVNGVAFNGNGSLFAAGYDVTKSDFVNGGATASLDGSANNFIFSDVAIDGDLDRWTNSYSVYDMAFIGEPAGLVSGLTTNVVNRQPTCLCAFTLSPDVPALKITQVAAPGAVPEPASWLLMILGFGVVGYAMRRRPAVRFTQAV